MSGNLQSCIEDGRRPPGVDFQELASNHPELLRSKGVVVNVRGKGVREGRQVSVEKMSESEPTDDASSRIQGTVKTGAGQLLQDEPGKEPVYWPGGSRCLGGMSSMQALVRNVRTSLWMQREMTSGKHHEEEYRCQTEGRSRP